MRIAIPKIRALTMEAINAALRQLDLRRVPEFETHLWKFDGVTVATFQHGLGRVPQILIADGNGFSGTVYANPQDRKLWTDKTVVLRSHYPIGTVVEFYVTLGAY